MQPFIIFGLEAAIGHHNLVVDAPFLRLLARVQITTANVGQRRYLLAERVLLCRKVRVFERLLNAQTEHY